MLVKVNGENINVEVSDSGMFFDSDTKKYSAKTLKGLQTKLQAALTPKGGVPVEHIDGTKKGIAINKVDQRSYQGSYVVKWEDNTRTQEYGFNLRRITTDLEKQQLETLDSELDSAEEVARAARDAQEKLKESFSIQSTLETVFPNGRYVRR